MVGPGKEGEIAIRVTSPEGIYLHAPGAGWRNAGITIGRARAGLHELCCLTGGMFC